MSLSKVRIIKKEPERTSVYLTSSKSGELDSRSLTISGQTNINKRRGPNISKEQLEALYFLDSLTFRIVQKYIENMIGGGFFITGGTERSLKLCSDLLKRVDFQYILGEIIRDIFVTGSGNAWLELGYNKQGNEILTFKLINPKSEIDYIRDTNGNVLYDKDLRAEGFKLGGIGYPKMEWRKDKIIREGSVVWTPKRNTDDGRDRIAHFKLIGLGEEELGVSPLEPGYKSALIRLNLEDTVGNSAFRSSAIFARVGSENEDPRAIPDEVLENIKKELANIDQDNVWSFRRNIEISTFPSPNIVNFERLMYYFADLQSSGSGIGISLILQPLERGYRGDIEIAQREFMHSVMLFQNTLASQIRSNIFMRALKAQGISIDECPSIVFRGMEPDIGLSTARRWATYARSGLLKYSPELEKWIKAKEGIPLD